MYSDVLYSLFNGFVGAILFLVVDKYEPEGALARLLKFLILFVAGVAILHRLQREGRFILKYFLVGGSQRRALGSRRRR